MTFLLSSGSFRLSVSSTLTSTTAWRWNLFLFLIILTATYSFLLWSKHFKTLSEYRAHLSERTLPQSRQYLKSVHDVVIYINLDISSLIIKSIIRLISSNCRFLAVCWNKPHFLEIQDLSLLVVQKVFTIELDCFGRRDWENSITLTWETGYRCCFTQLDSTTCFILSGWRDQRSSITALTGWFIWILQTAWNWAIAWLEIVHWFLSQSNRFIGDLLGGRWRHKLAQ